MVSGILRGILGGREGSLETQVGPDRSFHSRRRWRSPARVAPAARQFLEGLEARPLVPELRADVAALVRRAGTIVRLRPKRVSDGACLPGACGRSGGWF